MTNFRNEYTRVFSQNGVVRVPPQFLLEVVFTTTPTPFAVKVYGVEEQSESSFEIPLVKYIVDDDDATLAAPVTKV